MAARALTQAIGVKHLSKTSQQENRNNALVTVDRQNALVDTRYNDELPLDAAALMPKLSREQRMLTLDMLYHSTIELKAMDRKRRGGDVVPVSHMKRMPWMQIASTDELKARFPRGFTGPLLTSNVVLDDGQSPASLLFIDWATLEVERPALWYMLTCCVPWQLPSDGSQ